MGQILIDVVFGLVYVFVMAVMLRGFAQLIMGMHLDWARALLAAACGGAAAVALLLLFGRVGPVGVVPMQAFMFTWIVDEASFGEGLLVNLAAGATAAALVIGTVVGMGLAIL